MNTTDILWLSCFSCPLLRYTHTHTHTEANAFGHQRMSSRRVLVLVFCRGNIKDASNKRDMQKYLNKCQYHEEKEPYCPNFRLGYIAHKARENFTELCRTVSKRSTLQRVLMFRFNVEQDSFSYSFFH